MSNSSATPWTVARQAPLSLGFCRQEYWSGLPFPSPEGLPHPGIGPPSPALQVDSFLLSPHTVGSAVYKQKKEDQGKDGTAKEDAVTWIILCS